MLITRTYKYGFGETSITDTPTTTSKSDMSCGSEPTGKLPVIQRDAADKIPQRVCLKSHRPQAVPGIHTHTRTYAQSVFSSPICKSILTFVTIALLSMYAFMRVDTVRNALG